MNRLFLTLFLMLVTICAQAQEKIRVACVGNSITYGSNVLALLDNCKLMCAYGGNISITSPGHTENTTAK